LAGNINAYFSIHLIFQVISVLLVCIRPQVITLPSTQQEWDEIAAAFEEVGDFPGICGAVDGSLIEVKRSRDYEGWYCRKGFPAFNVQVVVDHRRKVRSYAIRPGSANDRSVLKRSAFGQTYQELIPARIFIDLSRWMISVDMHFVADAGYTQTTRMLTPYPITADMTRDESNYNYLHSKSRIVVECALGIIKERFRILKKPLLHQTATRQSMVVKACFVLHNVLIELQDDVNIEFAEPEADPQQANTNDQDPNEAAAAGEKRDAIKDLLFQL
jgi:hypothetical protein